ncbi:hypothetical protein [Enterococcus faecalis]|uniref:hypothetical protein n=1 Tax=Enterococcus faecalis TaxID=1351 RepID=UPI0030C89CBA
MTNSKDIFNRKPTQAVPKNSSNNQYLSNKKESVSSKSFQNKILHPESELKTGQNVRLHKETHALIKAISLTKNTELYSIVQESIELYLKSLDKSEQKEIWKKLESLIELKIIKI